jgi:hypothetical protein
LLFICSFIYYFSFCPSSFHTVTVFHHKIFLSCFIHHSLSFFPPFRIPTSSHVFHVSSIPRKAKDWSSMDREGVGAGWSPLLAYCCVPLHGRLAITNQPKTRVVIKVSILVITIYMCVNIMQRGLD